MLLTVVWRKDVASVSVCSLASILASRRRIRVVREAPCVAASGICTGCRQRIRTSRQVVGRARRIVIRAVSATAETTGARNTAIVQAIQRRDAGGLSSLVSTASGRANRRVLTSRDSIFKQRAALAVDVGFVVSGTIQQCRSQLEYHLRPVVPGVWHAHRLNG